MEHGNAANNNPIYVLKVNLKCCTTCPKKIKKKLLKLPGVNSVAIDVVQGLVKITGTYHLDPISLLTTISKAGKLPKFHSMPAVFPPPPPVPMNCHHQNNPSRKPADDHFSRSQNGNPRTVHFSDHHHHHWPGEVHFNESAAVHPPVNNRMFRQPSSVFEGASSSRGRGPAESVPPSNGYQRWPEPYPPPPANRYYQWSEPVPYYWQEQPPPPPLVANVPGQYVFNDENTEGCVIV